MNYDCIVIGSGFGGSISAYELSKAGKNVCLIERGPWRESEEVRQKGLEEIAPLPTGFSFFKNIAHRIYHRWLPGGSIQLNKAGMFEVFASKDLNVICSNNVGGGSHVYAGLHAKPLEKDYWDTITSDLSSEVMDNHYAAIINLMDSKQAPEYEQIPDFALPKDYNKLNEHQRPRWGYGKGLSQETWMEDIDFNMEGMFGSETGGKTTLDRAVLIPAISNYKLKVKAQTEVLYITKSDKNFTVHTKSLKTGRTEAITAQKVVLAAGCINSIRVLKQSIEKKGINQLPALGKNFSANADMMALWMVNAKNIPSVGPYERIFTSSDETEKFELMQAAVSGIDSLPIPKFIKRKLYSYRFLAGMGIDESNGEINVDRNCIQINYNAERNPIIEILKRHFSNIAQASGKRVVVPRKLATVHPIGGAIISKDIETGVVNDKGEVFGVDGLYICDSSVFPKALGAPPSLSIASWSRYVSHHILEQ